MKLGKHQEAFSQDLAKLILFAYQQGYRIRLGDVWSKAKYRAHKHNSQHYKKLASDLNLFRDGRFLQSSKDHHELGDYWESLSAENRWGGRYQDGNHYERMDTGWTNGRAVRTQLV